MVRNRRKNLLEPPPSPEQMIRKLADEIVLADRPEEETGYFDWAAWSLLIRLLPDGAEAAFERVCACLRGESRPVDLGFDPSEEEKVVAAILHWARSRLHRYLDRLKNPPQKPFIQRTPFCQRLIERSQFFMQMNRVEIAGHLVRRPEIRYLPSGTPVANARMGQTYRFQDGNRQWQERTNWHSLSFYADLSKMAATFEKGDNIFVEGTIEQREFTPKDGAKRVVNEIVVRHCHVIAPARGATAAANGSGPAIELPPPEPEGVSLHDDDWPVQ